MPTVERRQQKKAAQGFRREKKAGRADVLHLNSNMGSTSVPAPPQLHFTRSTDGGAGWNAAPGVLDVCAFDFGRSRMDYSMIFIVQIYNNLCFSVLFETMRRFIGEGILDG